MILTLAEEAITNKYTVRQLKQAIEDLREHKDDHDPGKEIIRTLDQPVPLLEDPDLMALCTDKDRVAGRTEQGGAQEDTSVDQGSETRFG